MEAHVIHRAGPSFVKVLLQDVISAANIGMERKCSC